MSKASSKMDSTVPLVPSSRVEAPGNGFTVDEALNWIGHGRFQLVMLCVLGMTYTADAGEVLLLSFLGPDVKCEWGLSSEEQSALTSVVFVGMAVGSGLFGWISNNFGRKRSAVINVGLTAAAGIISAVSPNYWMLIASRFLVGVGLGGMILVQSMFSEFLPIEKRGKMMSSYQLFWAVGALFTVGMAWIVVPSYHWRGLAMVSAIPLVIIFFIVLCVPESPRYLMLKGKTQTAMLVLHTVGRINGRPLPQDAYLVLPSEVDDDDDDESMLSRFVSHYKILFSYPFTSITSILWTMWVTAALAYYTIVLLTTEVQSGDDDDKKCDDDHAIFSDSDYGDIMIDSAAELPAVLFTMFTIDIFGRKKLLSFFWSGCAASLMLLPISESLHTVLLFSARFFVMSLFNVILVMAPELYPSDIRSFAMGTGNQVSKIGACISPFIAQAVYNKMGLTFVALFLGIYFSIMGVMALFIPLETAGRKLTDTIKDFTTELETEIEESDREGNPNEP